MFLDATAAEMLIDYWAHAHIDNPKLRDEIVNEDFDADLAEEMAAIAAREAARAAGKDAAAPDAAATDAPEDWVTVADDTFKAR